MLLVFHSSFGLMLDCNDVLFLTSEWLSLIKLKSKPRLLPKIPLGGAATLFTCTWEIVNLTDQYHFALGPTQTWLFPWLKMHKLNTHTHSCTHSWVFGKTLLLLTLTYKYTTHQTHTETLFNTVCQQKCDCKNWEPVSSLTGKEKENSRHTWSVWRWRKQQHVQQWSVVPLGWTCRVR